ncbi:c-type cytochrome [Parasulfitobacter algicola]|uniref:C-type cytochrome n=1 Tax=Parasulfitobacter algicola TaxID=2614809 RepID=A0ABX2ISP7_9RHOB|nr:c-type cytochrome [Sulfitobacter algicola]NSX55575.1 c-type cytochrome [Sulfitobacter algicola]
MRTIAAFCIILLPCAALAQDFFTLKGHGGPIMDVAVSPSGQILTGSFDNSIALWDGSTPQWLEAHDAAVTTILPLSDDLVISGGDDFQVILWVLQDQNHMVLGQHQGKVTALAAAPNGLQFASASWDGSIGLWSAQGDVRRLTGHTGGVNDVAFSADGKSLYSASSDGTIRLWDLKKENENRVILDNGFGINTLILNQANGWLAYGAVDGVTRIINPETGADIADFTLDRRPILAMALSPDTAHLAVGDGEGYIMVIDTAEWAIARDFRATLKGPIWALAFSQNGQNIHAGGLDDTLYSWPIAQMGDLDPIQTAERSFQQDPDTMENGERQFARKCSICHTLTPDNARRAGPTLYGVFGRKAGTVPDYIYSSTLTNSDIIWDDDTIDALFDEGPDHYIPGSKMPMQRITQQKDRDDLVAYLRRTTNPEINQE